MATALVVGNQYSKSKVKMFFNALAARKIARKLIGIGYDIVICPHLKGSLMYSDTYLPLILNCDKVVLLPGWEEAEDKYDTMEAIQVAHMYNVDVFDWEEGQMWEKGERSS